MKPLRAFLIALTAGGLSLALVPSAAQSADDTTPPTLTAPLKASFTVGRQIPLGVERYVLECGEPSTAPWDLLLNVAEHFSWSSSDASGPVRYDLVENTQSFGPVDRFLDSARTSYSGPRLEPGSGLPLGSNVVADCGGPNETVYNWNLTARDAAGNSTTSNIYGGQLRITQDNNLADSVGYAVQPLINYSGSWGLGACTCWSQGGVHKTSAAGASATILVPLPYSRFFDPERVEADNTAHVGLVMRTGPNRGAFEVFVNDVSHGIVDTFSQTNLARVVVWQTAVEGRSTIRIVNQATPGRARIDLDAVLTN